MGLDQRFEAQPGGRRPQLDKLSVVEHAHGQEHGVGACRGRGLEVAGLPVEVLAQDGNGDASAGLGDERQLAAEIDRLGHHREPGDGAHAHDLGERRGIAPAQQIAILWRARLDLGKDREQALALPSPNRRGEAGGQS